MHNKKVKTDTVAFITSVVLLGMYIGYVIRPSFSQAGPRPLIVPKMPVISAQDMKAVIRLDKIMKDDARKGINWDSEVHTEPGPLDEKYHLVQYRGLKQGMTPVQMKMFQNS